MNHVLCYAPYSSWVLHAMWEVTIAHACALRDSKVKHVLFDGGLANRWPEKYIDTSVNK